MAAVSLRTWVAALSLGAAVGFGALAGLAASSMRADSRDTAEMIAADERIGYWMDEIERYGPREAYERLAEWGAGIGPGQLHEEAHRFGAALYAAVGVAGISTCDSQYSFGCFHEFLARAIAGEGLASVKDLNQACYEALGPRSLSCQHGIGHGILTELGYDDSDMREALGICRDLPYSDSIGGCYGGVFMEYNHRTMWGRSATVRPADADNPYAPCDSLDEEYRPACLFWTPQWWRGALFPGTEGEELLRAMGKLCEDGHARVPRDLRRCFEGIGNMITFEARFDPKRVRELCDASASDKKNALWCRIYGANHLGIDLGLAKGLEVCADLAGTARSYCEAYARNELNIARPGLDVEL